MYKQILKSEKTCGSLLGIIHTKDRIGLTLGLSSLGGQDGESQLLLMFVDVYSHGSSDQTVLCETG